MATIEQRVKAGMALLDEKVPGWENEVDLERLDLSDCATCVLGQVYGSFDGGLSELDLWGWSTDFGFAEAKDAYSPLTAEWVRQISARRAAAAASGEG